MKAKRMRRNPLSACLLIALFFWGETSRLGAAGISLHIWMSKEAIKLVKNPDLKDFLTCHHEEVYNGAIFPDSGHLNGYGERAHWPPFMTTYMNSIKEKCRKGDGQITLRGECGKLAAHLFGAMSHMKADQVFDSTFLTEWKKRGLSSSVGQAQDIADEGMDVLAIWDSSTGIHFDIPTPYAPVSHLLGVFLKLNHTINNEKIQYRDIDCGIDTVWWGLVLERWYALFKLSHFRKAVPQWAKDNYVTGPGGVMESAQEIAKFWDEAWVQLLEPAGYQKKAMRKKGNWPNIRVFWEKTSPTS